MSLRRGQELLLRPANQHGMVTAGPPWPRRDTRRSPLRARPTPWFGSIRDQLLVLLLLANSGHPGFEMLMGGPQKAHVVTLAGLLMVLGLRKRRPVNRLGAVPFLVFGSILVAQCLSFAYFPYLTLLGFMVRLALAGVVCVLVPRFSLVFVRIMGILCALSLPFWILGVVGPWSALVSAHGLHGSADGYSGISILVHTYVPGPEGFGYRNAGMFWEPGALAGYSNLALLFLVCQRRILPSRTYLRYLALLTVGVLSTLSTTGFIAVLAAHAAGALAGMQADTLRHSAAQKRVSWLLPVGVVLLLAAALAVAWNRVDFLGPKIRHQYEEANSQREAGWQMTRFGTMIQDWQYICQRPLTGWGLRDETRWALHGGAHYDHIGGMGNDFSGFPARFGLLGMLTFLGLTFLGFQKLTGGGLSVSVAALCIVLIILNGEAFLQHCAFLSLMFLASASAESGRIFAGAPYRFGAGRRCVRPAELPWARQGG